MNPGQNPDENINLRVQQSDKDRTFEKDHNGIEVQGDEARDRTDDDGEEKC